MSENNNVDIQPEISYNEGNDANYELIDMANKEPLNDTECSHDNLVADPEDTLGNAIYHGCANPKCGRGWYIQPS